MLFLLKSATVYSPENEGKKDILICGVRILKIADSLPERDIVGLGGQVIDCSRLMAVPGFVDGHVHLIGGGGEGGFTTRTAEGHAEQFIRVGTTTVVGMLGTDGITRDHSSLLAKVRDFNDNGLNAYMLTGSYRYPLKTLTGDLMRDIVLIPEIVGVGELAISDHRSSNVSALELQRLAMDARVGGMLSGKKGVTVLHLGDGEDRLSPLFDATRDGTLNPTQLIPTHIDRTERLLIEGINWAKDRGGYIDFTADEFNTHLILSDLARRKMPVERFCVSSDGLGSLPVFDDEKNLIGIESSPVDTLFKTFTKLVKEDGIEISEALRFFTVNPARFYGIDSSGIGLIREGRKANLLLIDSDLEITQVFSKGRFLKRK